MPHEFVTPVAAPRYNQNRAAAVPKANSTEESISMSAENLRSEARARARLKSNSELGLSPEEKMQLLRKRLQYDQTKSTAETCKPLQMHNDRAMDERELKMSSSKSVNDLVYHSTQQQLLSQQQVQQQPLPTCTAARMEKSNAKSTPALNDFALEQNSVQTSASTATATPTTQKKSKRHKDPERRKSLIQSLSSFFHKSSTTAHDNAGTNQTGHNDKKDLYTANGSAQTERPGTSGSTTTSASGSVDGMFSRFRFSPKSKEKSKERDIGFATLMGTHSNNKRNTDRQSTAASSDCMSTGRPYMSTSNIHRQDNNTNSICQQHAHKQLPEQATAQTQQLPQLYYKNQRHHNSNKKSSSPVSNTATATFSSSSPQLYMHHKCNNLNSGTSSTAKCHTNPSKCNAGNASNAVSVDEPIPPPIPPLPLNYQRSDDESYTNETREQKKQRALSKAMRQAELKRLRIAQEIEREQEEIEVQLKELEARGVLIEKALRGEAQNLDNLETGSNDEKLLKELLEIWRNITQLKKRDEELGIRQQELQLEHRHAQLKEELNLRLSSNKLDKSSADVAAEGAILNEMLEIVAKRAALRPTASTVDLPAASKLTATAATTTSTGLTNERVVLDAHGQTHEHDESHI